VTLGTPPDAVSTESVLRVAIDATIPTPVYRLRSRLRLISPEGAVLHEEIESMTRVQAGRTMITHDTDLSSLGLGQGRYTIDVRVFASGLEPVSAYETLLVVDPMRNPVPVAIVVRCLRAPLVDFRGVFTADPFESVGTCATLARIAQLSSSANAPLSLAIAPVTLDEYSRVAGGYATSAGVVAASGDVPGQYAAALTALRSAVASGTLEPLDTPYAIPDLTESAVGIVAADLATQWAYTDTVMTTVLGSDAATSTAWLGDVLTQQAIDALQARDDPALLASVGSLRSGHGTAAPGCYVLEGATLRVLVADETSAQSMLQGRAELYDTLFDLADAGSGGVALVVDVGGTDGLDAEHVRQVLETIDDAPWLTMVDIGSLGTDAGFPAATVELPAEPLSTLDFWTSTVGARTAALAYEAAAGPTDADAAAVRRMLLIAESSLWRLADGIPADPPLAARAAGYAESYVAQQFGLVQLNVMDTTLSGQKGDVPVTLVNDTDKTLTLTLEMAADAMSLGQDRIVLTAPADESFLTVPVNLGNDLSGELHLHLKAGEMVIAERSVSVNASYIDRVVTVGGVVLVLIGLLAFIRRHMRQASTDGGEPD